MNDKDSAPAEHIKDMNLENAVSSDKAPFIFKWTARQGIYKVIFYAKTADASVAGWKVLEIGNCTFDIHNIIKQMIIIFLGLQYHCALKIFYEKNLQI